MGGHLTALHCASAMVAGGVAASVAFTPEEQRCAHRMTVLHSCLQAGAIFLSFFFLLVLDALLSLACPGRACQMLPR